LVSPISPSKAEAITRIEVEGLFGTYSYTLAPSPLAQSPERLLVLYGDNGSGKTTILTLLFHLLAPDKRAGHKSDVAKIPFSRFAVYFSSGDRVFAKRPEGKVTGSFTMGVRVGHMKEITAQFVADENTGAIAPSAPTDALLDALQEINIELCFLSDDRNVRLAGAQERQVLFLTPEAPDDDTTIRYELLNAERLRSAMDPPGQDRRLLLTSIKRAESWLQSQAVRGASEGESSVNALYSDILTRIAALPAEKSLPPADAIAKIDDLVQGLEVRSRHYSRYGLLPEFNGREILSIVKSAPPGRLGILTNVIGPYIEGVQKKLDAMAQLQRQVDTFVSIINSFFTRKTLAFDIHRGF
jgi:energy-coupling factor transporter ATP-binding protein EcfA2